MASSKAAESGLDMVDTDAVEKGLVPDSEDPWDVALDEINPGTKWKDRTTTGKVIFVFLTLVRITLLLGCLYLFICALDFLATAFRLLGGEAAGEVLQNSELLSNPICGLMIGVLVTVLVQSSSTSTSIVVSMTSARIISVKLAIPIIMGANIGTSVTNTIVSLGQAKEKNEFRRAFGGATVHDMFNWLAVLILLPLEVIAQPLFRLTEKIVVGAGIERNNVKIEILKVITKPFTSWVIRIDKGAIEDTALNPNLTNVRLLKTCMVEMTSTLAPGEMTTAMMETTTPKPCSWHWFAYSGLSDTVAGVIMLVFALALLCICLVCIVKLLNSLLRGSIALVIKKFVNADFPGYTAFLTGYLAILIGAVCTFIVQSSSIFTSAMTPLVGIGVITLERMYPLTLGSNIGTTATGIIAALPNEGKDLANAMQVALSHFFFNIFGILIWYPIPFMRKLPIGMARVMGNTTAKYRWFAIFYLITMFFVLPALAFALSIAGNIYLFVIGGIVLFVFLVVLFLNIIQKKRPSILPRPLRTWEFLPWWMHSLKPLDYVFGCRWCRQQLQSESDTKSIVYASNGKANGVNGLSNAAFDTPL
ncbi:sodium-dependent phosphate transport protein 2B-like [Lytechinus variegatus]|uniref:sodium-dependent phosphate transport protein 2B-like n=1 Tax=Lytechinus variegatus TaxID=7654 RepID=UPI001BB22174|nr:sodium-dependent phosphate transport protein 2B-like [Lytechinus variegatus]